MDNQLFRKKSLESISSPEELHDYMRVTSPRLWMILSAIVALLVGFVVFASTVTMENVLPIKVEVSNFTDVTYSELGEAMGHASVCLFSASLPDSYQTVVKPGMPMRIGNERGLVGFISMSEDGSDPKVDMIFSMENPQFFLPDGFYDGELVLESTTPISFLWN